MTPYHCQKMRKYNMKMHASVVFIIFAIHCRFRQRFRLTKDAFRYVLSRLDFSGHMSSSIPAVLQLASTLSLLASGSFQHTVGNDFLIGMSQSATCRVVQRVAKEMETIGWRSTFWTIRNFSFGKSRVVRHKICHNCLLLKIYFVAIRAPVK